MNESLSDMVAGTIVKILLLGAGHELGHLIVSTSLGFRTWFTADWWTWMAWSQGATGSDVVLIAAGGLPAMVLGFYLAREEDGVDRVEWLIASWCCLIYSLVEVWWRLL